MVGHQAGELPGLSGRLGTRQRIGAEQAHHFVDDCRRHRQGLLEDGCPQLEVPLGTDQLLDVESFVSDLDVDVGHRRDDVGLLTGAGTGGIAGSFEAGAQLAEVSCPYPVLVAGDHVHGANGSGVDLLHLRSGSRTSVSMYIDVKYIYNRLDASPVPHSNESPG